jgi:predicted ester cyclase
MIGRLKHFMPDSSIEILNVIVDDDRVAVHSNIHGTPQGELFGVRFEAKPVSMMTVDVHAIVDGKIATTWHVEDRFGLVSQVGLPHPVRRERHGDAASE